MMTLRAVKFAAAIVLALGAAACSSNKDGLATEPPEGSAPAARRRRAAPRISS